MREVWDLIVAFALLLGGVAVALLAGVLAVLPGEAIGMHPGSALLVTIFGFLCVVVAGLELAGRHRGVRVPQTATAHTR